MSQLKYLLLTLLFCLFFSVTFAQRAPYRLLIYNKIHNSYNQVEDGKPYQIWVSDTLSLKGYFDEVNERSFAFVTKDSTYMLQPEEIRYMARITGFGERSNYVSPSQTGKIVLGTTLVTIGSIVFVPSLLFSFVSSDALIPAAISAIVTSGGIGVLTTVNNKKTQVSNTYLALPETGNFKLRIVKSTM